MTTNNIGPAPHISAIHLSLVGSRNMLVSDFKVASSGVGGGLGFSKSLKSILKKIAELEMQIAILKEMHPELDSTIEAYPEKESSKAQKIEKAFNAVAKDETKSATIVKPIEGKNTSIYKDAKIISQFNSHA